MTEQQINDLFQIYQDLCPDALFLNHYELEEKTMQPASLWKEFLQIPRVADWIRGEQAIIRRAEMQKLVQDVSDSKSVGQAQLIGAIQKMEQEQSQKTGAAFVYMYVPLDDNQLDAKNVEVLAHDPFKRTQ